MKVFEVTMEVFTNDKLTLETQYVTSVKNTLESVTKHFTLHCINYSKDLKGVREVLTIAERVE